MLADDDDTTGLPTNKKAKQNASETDNSEEPVFIPQKLYYEEMTARYGAHMAFQHVYVIDDGIRGPQIFLLVNGEAPPMAYMRSNSLRWLREKLGTHYLGNILFEDEISTTASSTALNKAGVFGKIAPTNDPYLLRSRVTNIRKEALANIKKVEAALNDSIKEATALNEQADTYDKAAG